MRVFRLISCIILLAGVYAAGHSADLTITEKNLSPELSSLSELRIKTEPSGAEVYLDGSFYGTSELVIPEPQNGSVKIELKKPGFNPVTAELRVSKNSRITVEAVLSPYSGILRAAVTPDSARIFADRTLIRQGDNELPIGLYRVSAEKAGYRPYTEQVRVYADTETIFSADLTPLPPAPASAGTETDFTAGGIAGLRLAQSAEALHPGGFLVSTGLAVIISDTDLFLPFSVGLRFSILPGFDFSGSVDPVFSTGSSEDISWSAEAGIKYQLNPEAGVFSAAAGLSACYGSQEGLSLAAAAPLLLRLTPGGLTLDILLGPEITAAPFKADGSPTDTGIFRVAGAAGLAVNLDFLRLGISAKTVFNDFESSAAAEVNFLPRGTPVILSGFSQLDFSAAGIAEGAAPVFSAGGGITLSGF